MSQPAHTDSALIVPGLGALFGGFFAAALMGFGGVLPHVRRIIVERRRWLAPAEFTDLLALCQFLPGGNVINLAAAVGLRFRGLAGAVAALAGLMTAPFIIVVALGLFYVRFQEHDAVRGGFAGLAAAAAGLIVSTSIKIAMPIRGDWLALLLAAATFAAIWALRLPLLPTMLVMAPVGIACAWWRR
jgi:chromate transporter